MSFLYYFSLIDNDFGYLKHFTTLGFFLSNAFSMKKEGAQYCFLITVCREKARRLSL